MHPTDDMELLGEYASHGSEEAFAALVSRHVNMVYSVAMRHVGNPHNAQEITQAVFIILAEKARKLRRETIISGWLFQTARLTAANFLRNENRRARREQGAFMQSELRDEGASVWRQVAPFLDDAIASLNEHDRDAIVLRYIKGLSLKDVGADLGWSEDAAKKRVARAVEKLRVFFNRRGVTLSAATLSGCIAAHSVEAAPLGLAMAVTTVVVNGAAVTASTSTLVNGTLKVMAWTKVKIALAAGVAAIVIVQRYEITSQANNLSLLREQALAQGAMPTVDPARIADNELAQLRADKSDLSNEVLKLRAQLASAKPVATKGPVPEIKLSQAAALVEAGRQLGLAVAQGDPTAFGRLQAMSQAEHQNFATNGVGMNDQEWGDFARETFAPLRAAFAVLTDEAVKGNQTALRAISSSIPIPELQGLAMNSVGVLAGNGDEIALQILLNPKDYGVLPSSAIGELKPAADNGNQKAIDALAAVTADPNQRALWLMAADGLGNSAASGNSVAVDALVGLAGETNESVRRAVIAGLQRASANQNAKAADTLRQIITH